MTDTTCSDCAPPSLEAAATPTPAAPAVTQATATASGSMAPTSAATAPVEQTFEPPKMLTPHVVIEFCDRCRWAPRASWTQTELMLTFPPPLIASITLQPHNRPETGGRFRVWIDQGDGFRLVWDRKSEGGFPELKVLKQRVRNLVQPEMDLGHSDKPGKQATAAPVSAA